MTTLLSAILTLAGLVFAGIFGAMPLKAGDPTSKNPLRVALTLALLLAGSGWYLRGL